MNTTVQQIEHFDQELARSSEHSRHAARHLVQEFEHLIESVDRPEVTMTLEQKQGLGAAYEREMEMLEIIGRARTMPTWWDAFASTAEQGSDSLKYVVRSKSGTKTEAAECQSRAGTAGSGERVMPGSS